MLIRDVFTSGGDEAWRLRESVRKRREYTLQAALLLLLVAVVATVVMTVGANLEERNIRSGFDFLSARAGFEIGETLIPFSSADSFLRAFGVGTLNTLYVSVWAIVTSTVLGFVVGLMRLSKHPMLRLLGTAHVEAYRNIPLLVLLFAIYLVVTEWLPAGNRAWHLGDWLFLSKAGLQYAKPLWGWWAVFGALGTAGAAAAAVRWWRAKKTTSLNASLLAVAVFFLVFALAWIAAGAVGGWEHPKATRFALRGGGQWTPEFLTLWLGLTLFTSAAIAEIVRAGVLAVKPGQWLAGYALGLTRSETVSYIVVPQSLRVAIPPLASQYMNLTKNSSLAVLVGYPDVVSVGNTAINVTAQALEVISLIMLVYLLLNLITAVVMNRINRAVMKSSF